NPQLSCASFFFFQSPRDLRVLHSFPTRRSSDLFAFTKQTFRSPDFCVRMIAPVTSSSVRLLASSWRPALETSTVRSRRPPGRGRSEEHTSELQSRGHLVCRLLLEKKKKIYKHQS